MTAAEQNDARESIRAAVQRVDSVHITLEAARFIVHCLGRLAEMLARQNGCPPETLVIVQHALAEACAIPSRQHDLRGSTGLEVVPSGHGQPEVGTDEAAAALRCTSDNVRRHCREGNLASRKVGRQYMITAASLESLKTRLDERKGA
jgi:hypothetical protein